MSPYGAPGGQSPSPTPPPWTELGGHVPLLTFSCPRSHDGHVWTAHRSQVAWAQVGSVTHREVSRRPQLPGWRSGPLSRSAGFLCITGDVLLPGPPALGYRNGKGAGSKRPKDGTCTKVTGRGQVSWPRGHGTDPPLGCRTGSQGAARAPGLWWPLLGWGRCREGAFQGMAPSGHRSLTFDLM